MSASDTDTNRNFLPGAKNIGTGCWPPLPLPLLIDFTLDKVLPCYAAARGREYVNYDGFQQQGIGTSQNVPISPRNKNKAKYLKAWKDCNVCK
jgi:hypothetical protein